MPGRAILSRREPSGAHTEIARVAAEAAPIPRGEDGGPVFREPWEAQAFALALYERGLFTWSEWAQALSQEIRHAEAEGSPADGSTYYHQWLSAVERLVAAKGVTSAEALAERRAAWDRAAHRTPRLD